MGFLKQKIIALSLTTFFVGCKTASTDSTALEADSTIATLPYQGPPPPNSSNFATANWLDYCQGNQQDVNSPITPNWNTPLIRSVAIVLSDISQFSFALYHPVLRLYQTDQAPPAGITESAQQFLIYLCGEFRDRPSMIQAKLQWYAETNKLAKGKPGPFDVKKNPWRQMVAADYQPFLELSNSYYVFKAAVAKLQQVKNGKLAVTAPVEPMTICHVKFMISEYIRKEKKFKGLEGFEEKYAKFRSACSQEDTDYYVDFRGDSNIKPNSPESNAMIWHSLSVANQCMSRSQARTPAYVAASSMAKKYPDQKIILTDKDCADYFRNPFASRWNYTRAGLGAWLLWDQAYENEFRNTSSSQIAVTPNFRKSPNLAPMRISISGKSSPLLSGWEVHYGKSSMGLELLAGSAGFDNVSEFIHSRLAMAVDRHTDWYESYYDDAMEQGTDKAMYTPFVASSYEMSLSDEFAQCGNTVSCPDGARTPAALRPELLENNRHKKFMFIFKIHKSKWYTPKSVAAGQPPDFDHHWFDETSFGETNLADRERAFDRLGTPLEDELDSILYLYNICTFGSLADSDGKCESGL